MSNETKLIYHLFNTMLDKNPTKDELNVYKEYLKTKDISFIKTCIEHTDLYCEKKNYKELLLLHKFASNPQEKNIIFDLYMSRYNKNKYFYNYIDFQILNANQLYTEWLVHYLFSTYSCRMSFYSEFYLNNSRVKQYKNLKQKDLSKFNISRYLKKEFDIVCFLNTTFIDKFPFVLHNLWDIMYNGIVPNSCYDLESNKCYDLNYLEVLIQQNITNIVIYFGKSDFQIPSDS